MNFMSPTFTLPISSIAPKGQAGTQIPQTMHLSRMSFDVIGSFSIMSRASTAPAFDAAASACATVSRTSLGARAVPAGGLPAGPAAPHEGDALALPGAPFRKVQVRQDVGPLAIPEFRRRIRLRAHRQHDRARVDVLAVREPGVEVADVAADPLHPRAEVHLNPCVAHLAHPLLNERPGRRARGRDLIELGEQADQPALPIDQGGLV